MPLSAWGNVLWQPSSLPMAEEISDNMTKAEWYNSENDSLGSVRMRQNQPRALEDGNWICDSCSNVNYPRRTECNKCSRKRGPSGDAVVKAYLDSIKPKQTETSPSIHYYEDNLATRAAVNDLLEKDPWIGCTEPSYATLQYLGREDGFYPRGKLLSPSMEGKRIAQNLVATFATSRDPIRDAGECLDAASLWLQTMKHTMQPAGMGYGRSHSASSFHPSCSPYSSSTNSNGVGNHLLPTPTTRISSFSDHTAWTAVRPFAPPPGSGLGFQNVPMEGGGRVNQSLAAGSGLVGRSPSRVAPLQMMGGRSPLRAMVRFEDYMERPSDYLRDYGDPAAVNATAIGGVNMRPEMGVNGNWECEECQNVNFPRRTNCYQCHAKRGPKGEETVRNYVRFLIEKQL